MSDFAAALKHAYTLICRMREGQLRLNPGLVSDAFNFEKVLQNILPPEDYEFIVPSSLRESVNPKGKLEFTCIVTIVYPTILERMVVRNYINMAIKKYQKLCTQSNKADYFGGVYNEIGFNVTEIPDADSSDLRSVIAQIQNVGKHFDSIDRTR